MFIFTTCKKEKSYQAQHTQTSFHCHFILSFKTETDERSKKNTYTLINTDYKSGEGFSLTLCPYITLVKNWHKDKHFSLFLLHSTLLRGGGEVEI